MSRVWRNGSKQESDHRPSAQRRKKGRIRMEGTI